VTVLGGAAAPSDAALADSLSRPERLAAHLRQAEVAGDRAAMTGHLLGAELAATRVYWLGQEVVVIGARSKMYKTALAAQSVPVTSFAPEDLEAPAFAALGQALAW